MKHFILISLVLTSIINASHARPYLSMTRAWEKVGKRLSYRMRSLLNQTEDLQSMNLTTNKYYLKRIRFEIGAGIAFTVFSDALNIGFTVSGNFHFTRPEPTS